ncbi:type VI secretion system-associated protein TagF [Rubrivivax gelatinosus]|uniref:Type VI secretion-associated protein n=1 Tax=Rubrivivax gelatinosus TaxID=28068 RepID=A0ABS1DXZ0_RUBGE|nr:type VI secretion system-associated protein TagF [Rubrivivax gelatinosus]MBK1714942.1 type VI secretion-associated protein [Rubrivivax gelatinosus]
MSSLLSRTQTAPSQAACFGKLPSQPDFVHGTGAHGLSGWIDRWVSAALDGAAGDPHWKLLYDRAPALHFAVLAAGSPTAIAGHLRPSADASGRRFPFVAAVRCDTVLPRLRLARAPLVFARVWRRCADACRRAGAAGGSLLSATEHELGTLHAPAPSDYDALCADHAALQTVAGLEAQLRAAHAQVDLSRALLGLGALLQPVAERGAAEPARGLSLPLPQDPMAQALVGAWWTGLIADALAAAGHEWLLMCPQPADGEAPRLLVGLAGATPRALQALWDPQLGAERFVDLTAPAWAAAVAARDERTHRLASYLEHDAMSLALAGASWREAFAADTR